MTLPVEQVILQKRRQEHKRTRAVPDGIKKKECEYHQRLAVADIKPSSTNRLRKGKRTQKEKEIKNHQTPGSMQPKGVSENNNPAKEPRNPEAQE